LLRRKFISDAFSNELLLEVSNKEGQMVSPVDAILGGEVNNIKNKRGTASGAPFKLDVEKAQEWIDANAATQREAE
jgi:hypothetical protein